MRIATLSIVLLMAGCATGNPVQVADIKVASPQAVAACDYRDTVHGTSGLYGMFAEGQWQRSTRAKGPDGSSTPTGR